MADPSATAEQIQQILESVANPAARRILVQKGPGKPAAFPLDRETRRFFKQLLERLEDLSDVMDAEQALAESSGQVPYEEFRKTLGLK